MDRLKVREQIKGATQPLLLRGEFIRACGRARAREYGRRRPLIFRRRSLQYLAVTNRRLIVFRAPRRRHGLTPDQMLIAKRHPKLVLEGMRRSLLRRLKVQIGGLGERGVILKFRARDDVVGRELTMLLQAVAATRDEPAVPSQRAIPAKLAPVADEIAGHLPHDAPWTARPAFEGALRSLAWIEAQLLYLRRWIDDQGITGADGHLRDAFVMYERLEDRASTLRAELGLTPLALAKLLDSLATVAAAHGDDDGLATLKAEGERIVSPRPGTLPAGRSDEGSGRREIQPDRPR